MISEKEDDVSAQVYIKAIKKLEEVKVMLQSEMDQSNSSLLWNLFLASQQRYTLEDVLKMSDA